jgi:hypothetical protein
MRFYAKHTAKTTNTDITIVKMNCNIIRVCSN